MLTDRAVAYLHPLAYRETARRIICLLPLGGIYWDDEIPDFDELMKIPEPDRAGILNLFRIRFKIWDRERLNAEDQALWDAALQQVPDYALFRRLELSEDDRTTQKAAEQEMEEIFSALLEDADEVAITERDGIRNVTGTFDLRKGRASRRKQ